MIVPILLLLADAAAPVERPRVQRVEIGGNRYGVASLRDRTVTITGGDPAAPHTPATMNLFRTAVFRVSGCRLINEYWSGNAVQGKLDCSARVIP